MAQYFATYKSKTGRVITLTRTAFNYHQAVELLPRWSYPDGTPYRRIGSPQLVTQKEPT